jgi:hypothetical protein
MRFKRNFLLIACILASGIIHAQEKDTTYWKTSFLANITFNQASFSENWTAGGVNSIGLNSVLKYRANYLKGKNSWDNQIDLRYGFLNNEGSGYRKNNDLIFLDTKYGYTISPKWNLFGALNLLTQFANGFRFEQDSLEREVAIKVSEFMAPGYFTSSWGFEYLPTSYFKLRLSPFAPRVTVVSNKELYQNVPSNYGVDIGQTTRWEWLAFQLLADFDKDLSENLNLKFRYMMFANYESLNIDEIDHRLDAVLRAKVAKYIEVSLTGILVYDYDQDRDIQLSQALGIGFTYTIKNHTD